MRKELYAKSEELAQKYLAGATRDDLAKDCGCSRNTISNILTKHLGERFTAEALRRKQSHYFHGESYKLALGKGHEPYPLGTIRVFYSRCSSHRTRHFIKVRDDRGARKLNWKPLDVYNWEMANLRGLPEDYRIDHIDGDSLNDDPSNLRAVDQSDALYYNQERHKEAFCGPKWHEALVKARRRAARRQRAERRIIEAEKRASLARRDRQKKLEAKDAERLANIREIIPIPSCVKERMRSGWWDNREDDDDSEV